MSKILKLKHWQVFLILLFIMLIRNFEIEENPTANQLFATIGSLLFIIILITYGHCLYDFLPKKVELNYNLFMINCFLVIATILIVTIVFEADKVTFTGIYALPVFYLMYAFVHSIAFPAKVLRSIELKKEANLEEYIGMFFMIIFWPLCIWFIQPRVNRIIAQEDPIIEN